MVVVVINLSVNVYVYVASAEVDSNNSRYSSADLIINGDVVDGVTDESSNDDNGKYG